MARFISKLFLKDKYFKIFLLMTIIYIMFVNKSWTSVVGNLYVDDNNSYYGYVASIVNDFDFDMSNNEVVSNFAVSESTGKLVLQHPIGPSILLLPFYIIAKPIVLIISFLREMPFNQKDPIFFIFMCSGIVLYFYLGFFMLYRALCMKFSKESSLLSIILIVWGTMLPVYAFRNPIFSHVPEVFIISMLVYYLMKFKINNQINLKQICVLALLSGGVLITRWNDVHILLFVIYYIVSAGVTSYKKRDEWIKKIAFVMLFSVIVFLVFFLTQSQAWKCFSGGYFETHLGPGGGLAAKYCALTTRSIATYVRFFIHMFIGKDWGLLYTMLPFVLGLIMLLVYSPFKLLRAKGGEFFDRLILTVVIALPFLVVFSQHNQAAYYGYRLLLSLLPFSAIGLAKFIDILNVSVLNGGIIKKIFVVLVSVVLILNFFLILPFEYTKETTLKVDGGKDGNVVLGGWGNSAYVLNAVKFYFVSDKKVLAGAFMKGYAGAYFFGLVSLFSDDIGNKYSPKIEKCYALRVYERIVALFYPFLVLLFICGAYALLRKKKIMQFNHCPR